MAKASGSWPFCCMKSFIIWLLVSLLLSLYFPLLIPTVHLLPSPSQLSSQPKGTEAQHATYIVLTPTHPHTPRTPHPLHIPPRPTNQPISLQTLIILNMFGELAQRIARRRAFCASHERHRCLMRYCSFRFASMHCMA